ncbi:MAG: MliC family protein [Pseudorhodobacter sp.]
MNLYCRIASLALSLSLPGMAWAEGLTLNAATYHCERGVEVPVAYVTGGEDSIAVLTVEGRQIALYAEPAASGARYAWPSGGSGYVWWTKGDGASLFWKDGANGSESPLLQDCSLSQ